MNLAVPTCLVTFPKLSFSLRPFGIVTTSFRLVRSDFVTRHDHESSQALKKRGESGHRQIRGPYLLPTGMTEGGFLTSLHLPSDTLQLPVQWLPVCRRRPKRTPVVYRSGSSLPSGPRV